MRHIIVLKSPLISALLAASASLAIATSIFAQTSDQVTPTAFGMAIGVCGSVAATQEITSLLFGTSPLDPFAWIGMVLVLATVACIACLAPAWRAARIDPSVTLRAD
jgi:ABC-type lipoprotein release transport system permease subunit